jgi:hypothetical protein
MKISGELNWSWWWVFSPIIISGTLNIGYFLITGKNEF